MKDVLVVEDDELSRDFLASCIASRGLTVEASADGAQASRILDRERFRLVITDLKLPDGDGVEILKSIQSAHRGTDVIVITGYGSVEKAVECMKLGAFDFLLKPVSKARLETLVERALERQDLIAETATLRRRVAASSASGEIVTQSEPMRSVMELVRVVADTDSTVLIRGESGTGKELIASTIHNSSRRVSGPLVTVNCGALPEGLLESELFGHEKGAFTSAYGQKLGRFELADGGTIFLDEVGELTPALQVKLLHVLQTRDFQRVGGTKTIKVDVRVISATNRDLEEAKQHGLFREDLYYRLNVVEICVPPLRERLGDIPVLAESILRDLCANLKVPKKVISPHAMECIIQFPWPGNVRELQNALERAVIVGKENDIRPEDLPDYVLSYRSTLASEASEMKSLGQIEREYIQFAMRFCDGNKSKAAKMLGIDRGTLSRKLQRLGLAKGIGDKDTPLAASS